MTNSSDVKVTDEDDFPPCGMMIKAKDTIMKERNWIKVSYGYLKRRIRKGKKEHSQLHAKKKRKKSRANSRQKKRSAVGAGVPALLHEERVIARAKEASLHPSSTRKTSPMERRHPGNFLLMWCQRTFRRLSSCAETRVRSAACYWAGYSTHLHGGRRPRCVVAGFVERGPAARSTRAELLGD